MAETQVINLDEMREFKRAEAYFEAKILDSILADDLARGMHYGKVLAGLRKDHVRYCAGEPKRIKLSDQGFRFNMVVKDEIVTGITTTKNDGIVFYERELGEIRGFFTKRVYDLLSTVALFGSLTLLDPSDFYSI